MKFLGTLLLLIITTTNARADAASFDPPTEAEDEFHFVVLGDAQFHDPSTFNRVVDQTRQLQPAFVIQVGDLIEGYNNDLAEVTAEWQRFAKQVAPLEPIRYIPVPGNHDVYNGDQAVDPRLESLFESTWGPLYFAFNYKNAFFIALNSDSSEGENTITGKQLKWLKRRLQETKQTHRFVFMHRPPALIEDADALHNLFKKHNVSHVFYGHHHHYHSYVRDNIRYTMTNAAANSVHEHPEVGGFHHLLQVAVRGDTVDIAVIEADAIKAKDSVWPYDNYDAFNLTRSLAPETVSLTATDETTFDFDLPLKNTSQREIQVFMSCDSADNRWEILPRVIHPLTLDAGEAFTQKLEASFTTNRTPESAPVCQLRVPLQTHHGQWIDIELKVTGRRDEAR